ncbi:MULTISPECIES: transcriptional repressor LexA [Acetobacter]|uniref:LexA repressor n=1 Tax=Acetobacter thailandicus TaxID=1502842 RepID=A0ABT3QEI2_9PROT|nr:MULTISPECIES: transcriptional repressor LexA [Acetobacter]MBS0959853.1 transcriptional repressor LexA [Acetobacter thailandicus]MBS0979179.1 transcriptional repressor LexA [Acetobacter thailandicus]MBS0986733.1 transcriptional repressor LexA [Acetobacter thailandicus]MBS1002299.1 transcriptional repressor LexA [Acetobacter thailandicus]MCX2563708.1 transcriptional repressor LexA [Acetobacter thailandicus]
MLTRKQYALLQFIDSYLKKTGFSPSFDEMKTAMGLRSKSGIHRLISGLEERGFLKRHHHRARALEVLQRPEMLANEAEEPLPHNVVRGKFSSPQAPSCKVPLYGRIAAGLPIMAMPETLSYIDIPSDLTGSGEYYALEVAGDSMINDGILDGDTVVIRRTEHAESGQIIVALIDENEVTLKRLRRKGKTIALEAANPSYETRIIPAERLRIQGTLAGLIRRY